MTCRKLTENWQKSGKEQVGTAQASPLDGIAADLERTKPGDIAALAGLTRRLKRAVADERLALNELGEEERQLNGPLEKKARGRHPST